jgi:FixJ family two-component response regulator
MIRDKALVAIVDDEESIRKALLRLFRLNSFRAEAFSSAADFLKSLSDRTPDCIVLDLHMPRMTGIELLRHLAGLERPPPVIVVTAHDEPHVRAESLRLGTRHYLLKPIDSDRLLESVRDVVRMS